MKNHLLFLFLISVCFGFAQRKDSLSVEEQQRREKNIQAGNPFKKFGYKPKIATLSKGEMIGVKYNKDKTWVGGSVGLFEI